MTLFFCLALPSISIHAEEAFETPVITKDLPSTEYLKVEKRSIASDVQTSALAAPSRGFRSVMDKWEDPYMPGEGEWSNTGNVGAPVGDISLPIILSILILYMVYKGATTSRRRNNL
ncbi:hypothetical protein [Dysgonomonas termitidis]